MAASSEWDDVDDAAPAQAGLAPAERRERIAEFVLASDYVPARDLAARFDVSLMTVHRDLDEAAT
jgi:DeoR/GlpR family transcriptional regulator of sugar metabolism